MGLFVIGDPHLGTAIDKSMDLFGPRWENHTERLIEAWQAKVTEADTVLVAGDISWAINLEQAIPDLKILDDLPGKKILLRGNHDFWWQSLTKIEQAFAKHGISSLSLLQNNAFYLESESAIIVGSRGWLMPGDKNASSQDKKIYRRELSRLENSLKAADRLKRQITGNVRLIAMLHYPPFSPNLEVSEVCQLLEAYGVERAYYGHIHHTKTPYAIKEEKVGMIKYSLISGDHLSFSPYEIPGSGSESASGTVASMTGYGMAQHEIEGGLISCELKSVNHRYHELTCRMPRQLASLELRIRNLIKANFSRGKLELRVNLSQAEQEDQTPILIDQARLAAYLKAYRQLASELGQEAKPRVEEFWQLPDLLVTDQVEDAVQTQAQAEQLWTLLQPCLAEAIENFRQSRELEGEALRQDILNRLDQLGSYHAQIEDLAPSLVDSFRDRLLSRLDKLLGQVGEEYYPQQRVATELAIYADKVAIDEEIVRLKAHFKSAQDEVLRGGAVGKKLDFIVQEMNREINTIASKSNNLTITQLTVAMKNEVEKIREQLQNME